MAHPNPMKDEQSDPFCTKLNDYFYRTCNFKAPSGQTAQHHCDVVENTMFEKCDQVRANYALPTPMDPNNSPI